MNADALDAQEKYIKWAERQKELKAENINYGAKWDAADDAKLSLMHSCGISVHEMSKVMGRSYGGIRSRLNHMNKQTFISYQACDETRWSGR